MRRLEQRPTQLREKSLASPVIEFMLGRKSVPIAAIGEPAPSDADIETMIRIASRSPDHGVLVPWRFVLYRGEAREEIGKMLAQRAEEREGPLDEKQKEKERKRLSRAPLVIGVISHPVANERIPEWEQFLSAGAAAMNLVIAANALGYATNWVTNWFSSDEEGRAILGLSPEERVAALVHIGTSEAKVPERPRPEVADVLSEYSGPWKG
jgi:nitroreductase